MKGCVLDRVAQRESILRDKPILVTLHNPDQTIGPLWPEVEGSPGWRLWQMAREYTGMTSNQYLRIFERYALIARKSDEITVDQVDKMRDYLQGRSRVIFVGYDLMIEMAIHARKYDFRWRLDYGFNYSAIPYPSFGNRYYHDPVEIALVGVFLADVYLEALQKRRAVIP